MRDGAMCFMNSETQSKCGDISNLNVVVYDEGFVYSGNGWTEDCDWSLMPLDAEFRYYIPTGYAVFKSGDAAYAMRIIDD